MSGRNILKFPQCVFPIRLPRSVFNLITKIICQSVLSFREQVHKVVANISWLLDGVPTSQLGVSKDVFFLQLDQDLTFLLVTVLENKGVAWLQYIQNWSTAYIHIGGHKNVLVFFYSPVTPVTANWPYLERNWLLFQNNVKTWLLFYTMLILSGNPESTKSS